MSSLMSDVPQTYLPDELVHAIVVRMRDRDKDYKPVKRGLTSCSLTCRHWASVIRPLLFGELIIRSAEDIEQLLALLNSPYTLHPYPRDCIRLLRVIDDRTSSSIPWSHQIFRLHRRIAHLYSVNLTIEKSGADDELPLGRDSSRSFVIIPRTLPGSIMPLARLTLSHLRLPSVKTLANYVEHLRTTHIELDVVTFVKEDVPDIRHRRPHSYPKLSRLTVSHCFEDIAGLLHWFNIANVLYACQGHLWVGDALAEKYIAILLSLSPHRDRARILRIEPDIWSSKAREYRYSAYGPETSWWLAEVSVRLPDDGSMQPYIHSLTMAYDEAIDDSSDTIQRWASFESALMDASGMNIPPVRITLLGKSTAKAILVLLLSGRILTHLHGHLGKVELKPYDQTILLRLIISPEDIFASAHITLDGETVELDAAERAEWLLSKSEEWYDHDGMWEPRDKREEYVRGLLRSARVAAATTDAGADTGPSPADEARGASRCIQETADLEAKKTQK